MCRSILPAHMYMHHIQVWCSWWPEKGDRSPEIGVTDGCEPPCMCCELKPARLRDQQVL